MFAELEITVVFREIVARLVRRSGRGLMRGRWVKVRLGKEELRR